MQSGCLALWRCGPQFFWREILGLGFRGFGGFVFEMLGLRFGGFGISFAEDSGGMGYLQG